MPTTAVDSTESGCWNAAEAPALGDKPIVLVAAVALVDIDGRVLIARRPETLAIAQNRTELGKGLMMSLLGDHIGCIWD